MFAMHSLWSHSVIAKAVFFDIDGTLVDSNDFHVAAWDQAFRDAGWHFEKSEIHAQIGKGADTLLPALVPQAGDDERKRISESHGSLFRELYLPEVKAFPGASELIEHLHASGSKILLTTSSSQTEVDHYVELLGIRNFLTDTVTGDDVENSKPAADIFSFALAKVSPLSPQEILAVGDTPYDVSAAAKCRIDTIAVRSGGFSAADLTNSGAVATYLGVLELLQGLATSPLARRPWRRPPLSTT